MQPTNSILILAIGHGNDALTIRSVAESIGIQADVRFIGENRDITDILDGSHQANLIVLACHGRDGNIITDELDETLRDRQPFWGDMTPEHVREFLRLNDHGVVCTGCSTGREATAQAFLDAGSKWYLAPIDDPDGSATSVFTMNFIYQHLVLNKDPETSLASAKRSDDESKFFKLYTR